MKKTILASLISFPLFAPLSAGEIAPVLIDIDGGYESPVPTITQKDECSPALFHTRSQGKRKRASSFSSFSKNSATPPQSIPVVSDDEDDDDGILEDFPIISFSQHFQGRTSSATYPNTYPVIHQRTHQITSISSKNPPSIHFLKDTLTYMFSNVNLLELDRSIDQIKRRRSYTL